MVEGRGERVDDGTMEVGGTGVGLLPRRPSSGISHEIKRTTILSAESACLSLVWPTNPGEQLIHPFASVV